MLTKVPWVSLCLWLLPRAEAGRQSKATPGLSSASLLLGWQSREEGKIVWKPQRLVPYQSLGKHDERIGENVYALLSQKLPLVWVREATNHRFNMETKPASELHLPSWGSAITSEACCNMLSGTEDGFCSQSDLIQGTPAFLRYLFLYSSVRDNNIINYPEIE